MDAADEALRGFFAGETRTLRLYRRNVASDAEKAAVLAAVAAKCGEEVPPARVDVEHCFNLLRSGATTTDVEKASKVLRFLLSETFAADDLGAGSFLSENAFSAGADSLSDSPKKSSGVVEFGPRATFASAWSSTCVAICEACGVGGLARVERSRRYAFSPRLAKSAFDGAHDRMTECEYVEGEASFFSLGHLETKEKASSEEGVGRVATTARGAEALSEANLERGLGFDEDDVAYYAELFRSEKIGRDPTDVELYDLSQSNSEHSRHWFFGGKQVIDGDEKDASLFALVKRPLRELRERGRDGVSLIAFSDNSSVIRGGPATRLLPARPDEPSPYVRATVDRHSVLTAETHNFPCAVAPFPGAETGVGGRLRDVQATGRGAHPLGGIAGYCVGDVFPELDRFSAVASSSSGRPSSGGGARGEDDLDDLGQQNKALPYPSHVASPLEILLGASDGASDYGNKFGEPVVAGYCRSFRGRDALGSRCEWIKPVMFSAGVGWLDRTGSAWKAPPEAGNKVAKIGGPAYKIGMGGGAASSRVSTAGTATLDFNAVQRGDAQMCNRMNRVVRACGEGFPGRSDVQPIASIHDQGCGGNGNVLKEIVDGKGAVYHLSKFTLGDSSMSPVEIWGAEYQESNALLLKEDDDNVDLVRKIADRENCLLDVVGTVTDDGLVKVIDDRGGGEGSLSSPDERVVVDLPLDVVLGKLPPKTFRSTSATRNEKVCRPVAVPSGVTARSLYRRIVALPSVGSKRFLVHKADRSVTGLVARQQCVGPFQLPLSDCAVVARSSFSTEGTAVAVGEAPQCSALDPGAMARRATAEMLTNLCFALVSRRQDVRLSGNWMWAAKLDGEGARIYEACAALSEALVEAEVAIDGGKDSLSMAAPDGAGHTVKAPGALTLTAYAPCVDIRVVATPDLKRLDSTLVFVDLSFNPALGGTALAQVLDQVGDAVSDVTVSQVAAAFDVVQDLLRSNLVLAGHDRSDGGALVALLEMAFAGNKGIDVTLPNDKDRWLALFDEGPGLFLEVADAGAVLAAFDANDKAPNAVVIGRPTSDKVATIRVVGQDDLVFDRVPTIDLWRDWEKTSFDLERMQRDLACVDAEEAGLATREPPQYSAPFFDATSRSVVVVKDVADVFSSLTKTTTEEASSSSTTTTTTTTSSSSARLLPWSSRRLQSPSRRLRRATATAGRLHPRHKRQSSPTTGP